MQIESRSKTFVKHPQHVASPDAEVASSADTSREQSGLRIDSLAKPRSRPPLGLPNGSVRAMLTILIVAVVISQVARGQVVSTLWTETLMIALAHYFSTRRFIKLAPELIHQLEAAGAVETELHPLFLPNRSIRILIFAAFGGLAIYLYAQGRLFEPEALVDPRSGLCLFLRNDRANGTSLVDEGEANARRPRLARYQGARRDRRVGLHGRRLLAQPGPSAIDRPAEHDARHGVVLLRLAVTGNA